MEVGDVVAVNEETFLDGVGVQVQAAGDQVLGD